MAYVWFKLSEVKATQKRIQARKGRIAKNNRRMWEELETTLRECDEEYAELIHTGSVVHVKK